MNVNNLWERIQINYTIKIKKLCAQCKWKFFNTKKNFSNENYSMQMLNIQLKWKFVNTNKNHTLKI